MSNRNWLWLQPDVRFDKEFKAAVINRSKEQKETTIKEVKEGMMKMSHQLGNNNKERTVIKKNQIEVLELKSAITEVKNSLKEGCLGGVCLRLRS